MPFDDIEFHLRREKFLASGPTGFFPLDETLARQAAVRVGRASVFQTMKQATRLLIQPRSGVSDHGRMKFQTRWLERAGADIATVTIDAYTRQQDWAHAAMETNLNGYPLPTRSLAAGRDLVDCVTTPVECRHGSPDGRVLCEAALACGMTSYEGGGIGYNVPYAKTIPLEYSLRCYQYSDRLTALCSPPGDPIDRELFGPLTAVLTPPALAIVTTVCEAALAIEHGVQCVTLGLPETGHFAQDIAMLREAPAACRRFLARLGLPTPLGLFTAYHQWMGVFPQDRRRALRTIGGGVIAAVAGGATKLINKTYEEAFGLPTCEANADSIEYCRALVDFLCARGPLELPAADLAEEQAQLAHEVDELLTAVVCLPRPTLLEKVVQAFARGLLDIPFPASRSARGDVLPARDDVGAIRFYRPGRLPFSDRTLAFHRARLGRARKTARDIEADVFYVRDGRHLAQVDLRAQLLGAFAAATGWEERLSA